MKDNFEKSIPTNGVFMSKSINDWLYVYLQSISYVDKNGITFVYPKDVNLTKIAEELHPPMVSDKLDNEGNPITTPISKYKLSRDMKKLIKVGLVRRGDVESLYKGQKIKNAYILEVQTDNYFKLIPVETLKYLLNTVNINCIRTYVYLLDKYDWKQREGKVYCFTAKEIIQKVFGLQSTTHKEDYFRVKCILDLLSKCELISIKKELKYFSGQQYQVWVLEKVEKNIKFKEDLKGNDI